MLMNCPSGFISMQSYMYMYLIFDFSPAGDIILIRFNKLCTPYESSKEPTTEILRRIYILHVAQCVTQDAMRLELRSRDED